MTSLRVRLLPSFQLWLHYLVVLTTLARVDLPCAQVVVGLRVAKLAVQVSHALLPVLRRVLIPTTRAHAQTLAIVARVGDDVTAIANPLHCATESAGVRIHRDTEHNYIGTQIGCRVKCTNFITCLPTMINQ